MVNPQGEGSDAFEKDEPYGGQQYPPYQDPNTSYQNPQHGQPQYQNPQYPNPQYGQPQYGQAPYVGAGFRPAPATNTLAIVSLVLAVLGLTFIPLIASVCAVVCGHVAKGQIKRTGEGGSGFATAGLIVGYVSIALFVLVVAAIFIFAIAASNSSTY
ncbi:MAG: DUF4190 domain-containing protein [Rhodococcus sp.]|jgi:hypothetical protein|uniref:DUF4190 domain-containing protein n=1 Tax=unclassified Rhodococcus (in: high G+C Gram-positive bacteria) TaxID=192944 RepID=UPI001A27D1ED|nr:DUF4190 domain-containing protein [Rhodococcus sp. (in: high G+C Gram-positive bacteria)]MBJ7324011.1 DUF4190 domain-containing protein [Rhodococcus sp. (in: high G+C Gram-positive bacteria)]